MSSSYTSLLPYYDNINIASNEMLINAVLNRNFKKLFDNDQILVSKSQNVYNGMYRVLPWEAGKTYSRNELVWFVNFYLTPKNEAAFTEEYNKLVEEGNDTKEETAKLKNKYYTTSLYLLRSLKNNNSSMPEMTLVDMMPVFDASGWKNEYPSGSIYTDYFEEFTAYNLKRQLHAMHEASAEYHKFGPLSSYAELDKAVLLTDMSNISPNRKYLHFPSSTTEIEPDNTIITGSMRKWDCGILEYDLIFKLGNSPTTVSEYDTDGQLKTSEELYANSVNLENVNYGGSVYSEYDNRKYYLNDSDSDIFRLEGGEDVSVNGLIQHNVNQFLNSYTGKISFPVSFMDTNYAIFPANIPSAVYLETTEDELISNINNMVFINKSMQSVTALLIVPNYESNLTKVLGSNKFRCQITGRWK